MFQEKKAPEKLGQVNIKIGVTHDQRTTEWKDLAKGQKLSAPLEELDGNYKLSVKASTAQPLHQVFLVLRSKESKSSEIIYAVPRDGENNEYKLDLVS